MSTPQHFLGPIHTSLGHLMRGCKAGGSAEGDTPIAAASAVSSDCATEMHTHWLSLRSISIPSATCSLSSVVK